MAQVDTRVPPAIQFQGAFVMAVETWTLDTSHSSIRFSVRHLVIAKVHGRFARWTGVLTGDQAVPTSWSLDVHIEAASIDTNEPKRDEHLRSADFLDAEHFPELTFRSRSVEKVDDKHLRVAGDLTIRGVTRPVTFDTELLGQAKDAWGNDRLGFEAKTALERKHFGLVWNQVLESGGLAVADKVEIALEVEAVRQQPAAAAA
jgi:polyisoprenoid-binding protein YceI